MCKASTEPGGPRRCSGDARTALARTQADADHLQTRHTALLLEALTSHTRRGAALSPSRALDFKQCPQLYKFRVIDKIPEPPSPALARGNVVHAALEALHALPANQRTPAAAHDLIAPAWDRVQASRRGGTELTADEATELLREAHAMIDRYYDLEDPTRFTPAATEARFVAELADGTPLRGVIDRIDVAPTGETRVVDYKTGRLPPEAFQSKALFQLKFYALALLRSTGIMPARLRLLYLGDGTVLDVTPDRSEIEGGFARTVSALWQRIQTSTASGEFPPSPSRLCGTCAHKVRCPAFNTP